MKLLIDTNVVLDVLLKREPHCNIAVQILGLVKNDTIQEYVSASAITDIYYISCRQLKNRKLARQLLKELLGIVSICAVAEDDIIKALDLEWNDFEDSVQYSVALSQEIDCIITRNLNDYKESKIQVWLPEQALEIIGS